MNMESYHDRVANKLLRLRTHRFPERILAAQTDLMPLLQKLRPETVFDMWVEADKVYYTLETHEEQEHASVVLMTIFTDYWEAKFYGETP